MNLNKKTMLDQYSVKRAVNVNLKTNSLCDLFRNKLKKYKLRD